tara:strand:- start:4940 stop:5293 length:354 start_codon:yes stop_codon:yes gene_type:complete
MKTNIKNLPEGRNYFTERGYSQSYPWVEVSRSPSGKTVKLVRVNTAADPEWMAKRIFDVGGFCGHCLNQEEQTWLFKDLDPETSPISVRMTKRGWARNGVIFYENRAIEFYDYNFLA